MNMFMPIQKHFYDMTPEEFEKYSLEILKEQTKGLENLEIQHNVIIKKNDGDYQIDGKIQFEVMGIRYSSLVECKHYQNAITREKVQLLYDKIRAIGAHKGILISTSNFQSGAIKFAKEHGIALIQIVEAGLTYATRAKANIIMNDAYRGLYNAGKPYIGVRQTANECSVCCNYLRNGDTNLKDFLIEEKEKIHER